MEREEPVSAEALLQDKASVTERGGREGDAEHERGVLMTIKRSFQSGSPGGGNGHASGA